MSGTSTSSGTSWRAFTPVKEGAAAAAAQLTFRLRARAFASGTSGFCARCSCSAARSACFFRFVSANAAFSEPRRPATTPTAREASWTWTTGRPYAGAILTAVWTGLVVAPPIRSGTANPSRSISRADVRHLLEGRRDETREADDVYGVLLRGLQDPVGGNHDAEVDHLVAVAREDDADDVLPDVVDVALHGREEDLALRRRGARRLPGLEVGLEVRDRALHDARALDDLRKEHLPGPEEVTDDVHPRHERALDDVQRPSELLPGFLDVAFDEVRDPVDEGV